MKFNKRYWNVLILSEFGRFVPSLFNSLMTEGEKMFRKKICLTLDNGIFLELRVELDVIDHRNQVE